MPNKRLILHIGRNKTGTSSIQQFLHRSAEALGAESAIYPRAGRGLPGAARFPPAHHGLAAVCAGKVADRSACEEMKARFHKQIAGYDTVIVSSESFQNLAQLDRLNDFFDDFASFDVHVIVYLREHLSYAVSAFLQAVHARRDFRTFDQFCAGESRIDRFIARWSTFERISFRPFEREQLLEGDVVTDFLQCAGVGARPERYVDGNTSIGGNLLYAKMVANRCAIPLLDYRLLMRAARETPEFRSPFFIDGQRAAAIRGRSNYNRIVMGLVGELKLKAFDVYPGLPDVERLEEDLMRLGEFGDIGQAHEVIREFAEDTQLWF